MRERICAAIICEGGKLHYSWDYFKENWKIEVFDIHPTKFRRLLEFYGIVEEIKGAQMTNVSESLLFKLITKESAEELNFSLLILK